MSYHISKAQLELALGENTVDGLGDQSDASIDQIISFGSALVDSAIISAGYTPPVTVKGDEALAVDLIKMATVGAVVSMLWGRKGLKPPEALNVYGSTFNALFSGDLKIPGLDPNPRAAVGGVDFSSSDPTDIDGRPQVFGGLRKTY